MKNFLIAIFFKDLEHRLRLDSEEYYGSKWGETHWKLKNLVDRVTQLESTIQCLSDENQKLMGMIYSKSTVNEILKGDNHE